MPDASGSLRAPLSRWGERLARLKIIRRKARAEDGKRRRFSQARLFMTALILRDIIDGTDFLGEVNVRDEVDYPRNVPSVCLLVTMSAHRFERLCEIGAELEDLEDTHDREPTDADHGEMALGSSASSQHFLHGNAEEAEPSLGSTHMFNQLRWSEGWYEGDRERDRADDEPEDDRNDYGVDAKDKKIIADARARIAVRSERERAL
jgi:hypothetical protein